MKINVDLSGLSFFAVIQIIFIVLKITGVIQWGWKLVLIPTWISLGIIALVLVVVFISFLWVTKH